ncbi:BisC Anaerobic dehydrogenases, typically selenocysteine-containing [Paracoccaceae bacterium]
MQLSEKKEIIGCCPLDCQDTCSWIATVEDGRVTGVRGASAHPITRGVLCAKVNDCEARIFAPDRLLHPLRRRGPKGSGTFERVSWEDALDTIARRFREIIDQHGPDALAPLYYLGAMGTMQRQALRRIFHGLGASDLHGDVCGAPMSLLAAEGHPVGFNPEEIAESRLILLWGANLLTACHHHWQFVKEARATHGARVIAIDPRRTLTTRQCDEHLAIRPGTDAVLAAAMAQTLIEDGTADLSGMRGVAEDLDKYLAQIAEWPAERAAAVCGIDAETIRRLARALVDAKSAVIRAGVGPQQTVSGEAFLRGLSALSWMSGQQGRRGGGLFTSTAPEYHDEIAALPDLKPRKPRSLDIAALGASLTNSDLSPQVHGLMVWCMNPAVTLPDSGRVHQGLLREDLFTVVVEHFMTDTARYADLILPSTTQLEHFDIVPPWGHHYIGVNHPAIPPLGEALSHGEIMRRLAPKLGLDHPAFAESDEQIAASALPAGVTLDALKSLGWIRAAPPPVTVGKLRFADEPILAPAPLEVGHLRLLTPKGHHFLNSTFANMPRQRKAQGGPTVLMHPDDAAMRGLLDGDKVHVTNQRGVLQATMKASDAILPGCAALDGKWWSSPHQTAALGNLLTPSSWSPGGQPAYNDTFVKIEAAAGRRQA